MSDELLYYFPEKSWLCTSDDELNFNVVNGGWSFELHSDTTVVLGREIYTGEYEVHTRESFDKCYPRFGH